jgi:hypothetical protein
MGRTLYALLVWAALYGGTIREGFAPHYAPGVMERVARHRHLEQTACMVASPTQPIGSWVWVYGKQTGALLHCKVVDTSETRDRPRHLRTRRYVELDFQSAKIICGSTRDRPERCPVVVVRIYGSSDQQQ